MIENLAVLAIAFVGALAMSTLEMFKDIEDGQPVDRREVYLLQTIFVPGLTIFMSSLALLRGPEALSWGPLVAATIWALWARSAERSWGGSDELRGGRRFSVAILVLVGATSVISLLV